MCTTHTKYIKAHEVRFQISRFYLNLIYPLAIVLHYKIQAKWLLLSPTMDWKPSQPSENSPIAYWANKLGVPSLFYCNGRAKRIMKFSRLILHVCSLIPFNKSDMVLSNQVLATNQHKCIVNPSGKLQSDCFGAIIEINMSLRNEK